MTSGDCSIQRAFFIFSILFNKEKRMFSRENILLKKNLLTESKKLKKADIENQWVNYPMQKIFKIIKMQTKYLKISSTVLILALASEAFQLTEEAP